MRGERLRDQSAQRVVCVCVCALLSHPSFVGWSTQGQLKLLNNKLKKKKQSNSSAKATTLEKALQFKKKQESLSKKKGLRRLDELMMKKRRLSEQEESEERGRVWTTATVRGSVSPGPQSESYVCPYAYLYVKRSGRERELDIEDNMAGDRYWLDRYILR